MTIVCGILIWRLIAIALFWLFLSAVGPQIAGSPATPISGPMHVDVGNPAASDSNPGTRALPLKTIGRAVQLARAHQISGRSFTVLVHPGIYREDLTITTRIALVAEPGAEIRGSDVWMDGWSFAGDHWIHAGVPTFHAHGTCDGQKTRCLWPEQVFYDGKPLVHVAGVVASGQFGVTADRLLVLADDPRGHVVEVTTRTRWIVVKSDGVTVRGFAMRHAANDAQSGGLDADSYSNIVVENNLLSDAHGVLISLSQGRALRVVGNELSRAGQLGIQLTSVADSLVRGNRIHDNNTDAFSWGWEAGGLKAARAARLTVDGNDVYANDGPGLWCDGDCQDVVFSNNRIHENRGPGIQYEISHDARIFANAVWKNGLFYSLGANHWGWGAGILVENSNGCEIFKNTLAWNRNGIAVLEQDRGPAYLVSRTRIHDNIIVAQDARPGGIVFALAWLSDHSTKMFDASEENFGASNRYGYSGVPEVPANWRFAWGGRGYSHLADLNATPGGKGGKYLTLDEQRLVLSASRIPLEP